MTLVKTKLFTLIFISFSMAASADSFSKTDFTTWPKADVMKFGCFLQTEFGYKDKKFNCSLKKYENKGDACENTKAYYEGPVFPNEKAKVVNPLIDSIDLSWEHGELQNLTVTLNKKMKEAELRKQFHLPKEADIQDCSNKGTCIVITGFDHMGAGDVGCGGEGGD